MAADIEKEAVKALNNMNNESDKNKTDNNDLKGEKQYIANNVVDTFIKIMQDFKNDFVLKQKENEEGLEEFVKEFYNSSLFDAKVKNLATIIKNANIKPPFISADIASILYGESDKKIELLRKYGIIENDEQLNIKNFFNESYIKGIETAAKEKNIKITAEDIYRWLILRPVFYHNDKFLESVKKVMKITDEDIEEARIKEENFIHKYDKEEEQEKFYNSIEILPSNMSYTFGIQRIEEVNFDKLKKISENIYMFNPDEAYSNIPSLKNNIIFNLSAKNNLISTLEKAYPEISKNDLNKIKEYSDEYYRKYGIQIIPDENNPYAIQGIYLKQSILNDIKDRIDTPEIKNIINEIIKAQNEIKKNTKRYVLTTTVNGWIVSIPEETLKEIKEKNYELIFKNEEAYYHNEFGEKIDVELGNDTVEKKRKEDMEIMKTVAQTESDFLKDNDNKFITGSLYNIDGNGRIKVPLSMKRLTETLTKRNGESINVDGAEYLRTNFDTEYFDSIYGKYSKKDAWYELITMTKQKYGLSSSKEAENKIRKEGIGALVIEYSKNDLKKYKKEGLKALSLIKTNTFLNKDGTLKSEFETAKNVFFTKVFTLEEISYFDSESEHLLNGLKTLKNKIKVYRNIMDESADALFNGVADFAINNFLDKNTRFKNKKDLLTLLESKREKYKNNPAYTDAYKILNQLVKRDIEISRKNIKNKNIVSFIKTNLEQSTDLKLTNNYEKKVDKIFNKAVKSHFFAKVFRENSLLENYLGYQLSDKNKFFSVMSNEILDIDNFGFINPNKFNIFDANLIKLKDAETLFENILNKTTNADEVEKIIKDLKNGRLLGFNNFKIEDFVNKNEWLFNYAANFRKEPDKIKEFLNRTNIKAMYTPLYEAKKIKKSIGIDPANGIENLNEKELKLLFNELEKRYREKFLIEWDKYINKGKQKIIGNSLEKIYKNISKDAIKKAFALKEKYNLSNEKFLEAIKKYAFLKELENEFVTRKKIFKLIFEEPVEGGVYPPATKEDVLKNLKIYLNKLGKEVNRDAEKNKIYQGMYFLTEIFDKMSEDISGLNDIKKFLVPRESIENVFGLFKEHLIENSEGIKKYEEILSRRIEDAFKSMEIMKYNKYIGMFKQLQKKSKEGEFSYSIEKLLNNTYFKKFDETIVNNYEERLTEEHNIVSNLNSLYSNMVYKAVRRSYDALSTKKQIEEILEFSEKGLIPLMVRENEKESFVITTTRKNVEKIYYQYKKIFKKIKNNYINDEGELVFPEDADLNEEEKEFIKQLYNLYQIDFPYGKDPRKKEKLNAIAGLMFTLNGSPLIEKKDIDFSDGKVRVLKRLDKKFPFLKNLDKNLVTVDFTSADMNVSEYQKLKKLTNINEDYQSYDENEESYEQLFDSLETKLLTISTEIDTLDGRMKTIKNEMTSVHDKYERKFNEHLKNNRTFNGSTFENAFNFVRFPLLMFEAFQIGIESAKQIIGEYFEYRRRILPLKEEINKRKEDLILLMNDAQKTEEKIAIEIQEFYLGFYSQNYSTMEEMINVIEKMQKDGNKFAEYILSNPAITVRDEKGKIVSIDAENLIKEINKNKSLLFGVYKTNKGGYRNIESLARARSRIKAIFAESQPNIFTTILGSQDIIYYDEMADFRIRKMFKAKFEVKDNAKQILVGEIEKENVKTLRRYTDIDRIILHLEKFKENTLFRSSNGSLVMFNIDEKALSEFRKYLSKKDKETTLEEAMDNFINMSSLYTIDYENFSDLNSIIKSLKNNSELSKRIENRFINEKNIKKISKKEKESPFKIKEKIKEAIFKSIININILSEEERKLLEECNIYIDKIDGFIKEKEPSVLIQQSLHKIYFNTTKRFFADENKENKYASPFLKKVIKDARMINKKKFREKYKINISDVNEIKKQMKNNIKNIIIDNIDLYEYDLVKKEKKFGGGKMSNTTKLLAEDGSKIVQETYSLFDSMKERVKDIYDMDGMRHRAKINSTPTKKQQIKQETLNR